MAQWWKSDAHAGAWCSGAGGMPAWGIRVQGHPCSKWAPGPMTHHAVVSLVPTDMVRGVCSPWPRKC